MAGDWIKVEHATGEKPEVLMLAELLGVDRRHCLGILLDYWTWLDRNACHGLVRNLSRQSLDNVLHCPGFAGALEIVGWVVWHDDDRSATISNYDRHNGNTAKTRASDQKRKAEIRGQIPDKTGTREEKRREDIKPKRESITAPTGEHHDIAKQYGVDCISEWVKYTDHQRNAKNKHTDLCAGFRNWLKRADEFRPRSSKPSALHDKRASTAAAMRGPLESHEPTDITAEVVRVA